MVKDKYTAVWVSHSSISDWLECPRAYYLKNVYKDPKTGRKMTITNPPLALGQVVHEVIESLSVLPVGRRFETGLVEKLNQAWKKISGKKGGFVNQEQESKYKERAKEMLRRVEKNPGPLNSLAVKIKMELPYYWLSEKDNIIVCGKIDWLEYLEKEGGVHIIDFKTGKKDEAEGSLQLPIYCLIAGNTQSRPVKKASYWYIDRAVKPARQRLPDTKKAEVKILKIAKEIKLARQLERFKCPYNGCRACQRLERVIQGKAEHVGVDELGKDVYIATIEKDEKDKAEVL